MARRTPQACPGPRRPAAVGPVRDGSRRTCCRTPPPPEPLPWIRATSSAVLIGRLGAPSSSCPGVDHRRSPEQPVPRGPWGWPPRLGGFRLARSLLREPHPPAPAIGGLLCTARPSESRGAARRG